MALTEQKIFTGGLNADDSDRFVDKSDYRNAINVRVLDAENGKLGSVQNVRGNRPVGTNIKTLSGKTGTFRTLGSYEDETNECIYDLVYNSDGYHILTKRDKTGTTILMKDESFVKDGVNKGLSLSATKPITTFAKVGDMLFWANGIPRRINVKRLQQDEYGTFDDDLISVIRRPPDLPPTWAKIKTGAAGTTTMIRDNAFQFAWRFIYEDGEMSVFSPYSTMAPYGKEDDNNDTIHVSLPAGSLIKQDVRFVELAVRYGNTGGLFVIKRWDRENPTDESVIDAHNQGDGLSFDFLNDRLGEAVPDADAVKPFENVPLESESLEAADNRIFLGNNKIGYNTPNKTSLSLSTQNATIDVGNEIVTAEWWWGAENYHAGFPGRKYSRTSWFLYLSGVEGKDDGFYGIDGVKYSEHGSHIDTGDNTRAPDSDFSFPNPVNYSDLQWIGTTDTSIMNFYGFSNDGTRHFNKGKTTHEDVRILGAPTQNNFNPVKIFKTGTSYQLGVVFYDRYLRSSSVVTNDNLKIRIPETSYLTETFVNKIVWNLLNNDTNVEIPDWAEYYSIVMTKNLRTRFFMQTYPYEISYVNKKDDGTYETKKESYSPSFAGIQIDITSLSKDGLGYVFNKGDIVKLYVPHTDPKALSVIDQYGKYIVCSLVDVGDLVDSLDALIEIYTPYKASTVEPFWEIGQMFPVAAPGTSDRQYSTTEGTIDGDVWMIARKYSSTSTHGVEAMSPNDKYYQNWWTDSGRPNVTPQPGIGQATKETGIAFSNQYIPKTLINGLSSFDATNIKDLPDSCGPIRKLLYTSKVQGNLGGVLLAICENETASIYIGQTEVQTQSGDSFLAASPGIIGSVNILKGSYGTINPESIAEKDGHVYWLCIKRGKIIQYAVNGLYPVSDYKMKDFFEKRCRAIDVLSDNQKLCPGGYDPTHDEYLISLPKIKDLPNFLEDIIRETYNFSLNFVSENPMQTPATILNKLMFYGGKIISDTLPATVSVSYEGMVLIDNKEVTNNGLEILPFRPNKTGGKFTVTSTAGRITLSINQLQPNYHEADCGQEMVLGYKPAANRWTKKCFFQPENMVNIGKDLYAFQNGDVYIHDDEAPYNTFFGEKFPSLLAFVSNENSVQPRVFIKIVMDANLPPDYLHLRTEVPWSGGVYHQSTDLIKTQFSIREGKITRAFEFDRLSPNKPGKTYDERQKNGDKMRAAIGKLMIEYDEFDQPVTLDAVGIVYNPSSGHNV